MQTDPGCLLLTIVLVCQSFRIVNFVSANVNFLVADGTKFTHPLHHLGKSLSDLPVLAIDSFRHMYVFPHNAKTDLE